MTGETRPLRTLPRDHEALLGVFEGAPSTPGGMEVKCPFCGERTADAWSSLGFASQHGYEAQIPARRGDRETVILDWMRCANEDCSQAIIRIHEQDILLLAEGVGLPTFGTRSWLVRPQWGSARRHAHGLVPEPFRTDYQEAAMILAVSPRMSAVMSRRVLADLLEKYANLTQFNLEARIDAFAVDATHPGLLRENLHHFREAANFGAHTQKDDQAEVIDVGPDEAEWMLDLLDRLFDYFIVTPARDQAMREAIDKRIKDAGRREIKPPPGEKRS